MSRMAELKSLLVKANINSVDYDKLLTVIEAFFWLRSEFIQAIQKGKLDKAGLDELIHKAAELDVTKKGATKVKKLTKLSNKFNAITKKAYEDSIKEVDEIIENMLKSQDNMKRLYVSGVGNRKELLESVYPNEKVPSRN